MKYLHFFPRKVESFLFMIMLIALLAPARMWGQETLTIYSDGGNAQNACIPFYGNYVNYYQKNEFIIPASKIVAMDDGIISKMTFYTTYTTSFDYDGTFQIFLKEVSQSTFPNTSFMGTSGATIVYEGPLSRFSGLLTVDFTTNFTYHGGNLLIGFYETETCSDKTTTYFYGENVANSSLHGRHSSSLESVVGSQQGFLPEITFEYTSAECVRPHFLLARSVSSSAVLLTWEPATEDQDLWEIYYTTTANDVPDENTTATISNITHPRHLIEGLTENTKYYVYVRAVCGGDNGHSRWSDVCSFTAKDSYDLTICDGSDTQQYIPFNYYYQYQYQKCEFIIPASKIDVMEGGYISSMSFYHTTSFNTTTSTEFAVWLKEVDMDVFSNTSFIGTADATQVYTGTLHASGGVWTLNFTEPYLYSGRNLLVCFYLTVPRSSQSYKYFKGEFQSGNVSLYKVGSGSLDNLTYGTLSTFLPKIKFDYFLPCPMPSDLTIADLGPHMATLTWNEGFLESNWEVMVNDDDQNIISVEGTPTYTMTGLDAETTYSVKVRAACGVENGNSSWTDAVTFTTLVACPTPTNLHVSNLGQHTATLNWTPGRDETSWLLVWSTDGDFNPDEATPIEIIGAPAHTFTGLTAETLFYVYLRADCDEEGNSLWSNKFTFRTALYNPIAINDDNVLYYDGFDGETFEWEMANGTNHWMRSHSTWESPYYAMHVSCSHSCIIDLSWRTDSYVYKTFELEGGKEYEISFDWKFHPLHTTQDRLRAYLAPANAVFAVNEYPNTAGWIPLGGELVGASKYVWYNKYVKVQIPEEQGGSYKVVFYFHNDNYGSNGSSYWDNVAAIDNFIINTYMGDAPRPSIPEPEPNEVTLEWEDSHEVEPIGWQIIYSTDPDLDPYSLDLSEFPDNLPEGVEGVEIEYTDPKVLEGLDPETGYYVYIRTIFPDIKKDGESQVYSRWSEQLHFVTPVSCYPVDGVELSEIGTDNATLTWTTVAQQGQGNMPATWNVKYKKNVQAGTTSTYTFEDGTNPASYLDGWKVGDGSLISTGFVEDANTAVFAIQLPCMLSFDVMGIDADVSFNVCITTDELGQNVITSMGGSASDGTYQTQNFDLSEYEGTYYLAFLTNTYTAPIAIDNLTLDVPVWTYATANGNSYTMSELESKTDYLFAVQAHCGEGDDSQWVTTSFRSAYGNMEIPYEEDFDSYSSGELPEGWLSIADNDYPAIVNYNPHTSPNSLFLFSVSDSEQYAILPPVENVSSLQMEFWLANVETSIDQSTFTVGVMTDPEDATTFEPVKTFTTTSVWTKNVVYFADYEGEGQYIAIQLVGEAETYKLVAIDDVVVSELPSCFVPENLTVNLTTTTAELSWIPSGDETQWNLQQQVFTPITYDFETDPIPSDWDWDGNVSIESDGNAYSGDKYLKMMNEGRGIYLWPPVTLGGTVSFYAKSLGDEDATIWVGYYDEYENYTTLSGNDGVTVTNQEYSCLSYEISGCSGDGWLEIYVEGSVVAIDNLILSEQGWGESVLVENTPTYVFDNLSSGTYHKVRVQAVCGADDVSGWVETEFTMPFCDPESQCSISYMFNDSYGDGWNGAAISIVNDDDVEVARLTMTGGSSSVGELALCPGTYSFVWCSGSFDGECSFVIIDPNDNTIIEGSNPSAGVLTLNNDNTSYLHRCQACETFVVSYENPMDDPFEEGCWATWTTINNPDNHGTPYAWSVEKGIASVWTGLRTSSYLRLPAVKVTPTTQLTFRAWTDDSILDVKFGHSAVIISTDGGHTWDSICPAYENGELHTISLGDYAQYESIYVGFKYSIYYYSNGGYGPMSVGGVRIYDPNVFTGETKSTSWSVAGNWSQGVPDEYDWVMIDAECDLDANAILSSVIVNPNKTLTILDSYTLMAGQVNTTSASQLVVKDGGQLMHYNDGVLATIEKEIAPYTVNTTQGGEKPNGWYLISFPVKAWDDSYGYVNITPDRVTGLLEGNYDLYMFDPQYDLEWRNYKSEDNGSLFGNPFPTYGYLYANDAQTTLQFEGMIFPLPSDGSSGWTASLVNYSENALFGSWNLVGNPQVCDVYPIAFEWGWDENVDLGAKDYYRMNQSRTELILGEGAIHPLEGVFLLCEGDYQDVRFSETPYQASGEKGAIGLSVAMGDDDVIDRTVVRFGEGSLLRKFQLNASSTRLCVALGGQEYAVARSADEGEIPVNFKAEHNGNYTITLSLEDVEMEYLHLIDNLTGADVDLLALRQAQGTASYTFNAMTTDYACRFKLVFKAKPNSGDADGNNAFAFFNGSEWVISNMGEATLQVVDMMGHVLTSETIYDNANIAFNAAVGVYVMRLVNGNEVRTQKIVVR